MILSSKRLRPLICFINRERGYTLTTNYKVMFSTLLKQPGLEVVYNHRDLLAALSSIPFPPADHLMLVRNPFLRLLSFYADKFVTYPPGPNSPLQNSHRLFLSHLGFDENAPPARMTAAFTGTTFGDFVAMLDPTLIYSNLHLIPQSATLRPARDPLVWLRLRRRWSVQSFVKMEEDLATLLDLGIDLGVRENPTSIGPARDHYDTEIIKIVSALYRRDFATFGYPTSL